MRLRAVLASLAMLALATCTGCDGRGAKWLADRFPGQHSRPVPVLAWQEVDPAALVVNNDAALHAVRFSVHLPAAAATKLPPAVALDVAFNDPLDGAKVDASATGPLHTVTLLQHKRFAGDTVATPLPPLPLTDVEVVVHNHLRPPPVIRSVRVGRPLAAAPASTAAAVATGGRP
jgi:hypothetical protein